ncbi:hypothetical protein [Streptomyces sp. NPDC086838]|jgi:hypothetical protein|uniref:hypothetical protein n=1 Tax=Streptomyces sp. NPDC086838 TaxID=3365762 RepID=UPI0037FC0064
MTETHTATAHIEVVDYLPGDRTVYPVEIEGELVWLVLRGEMTDRLRDEFNEYLEFITASRMWLQNWADPTLKSARLRRVS